MISSLISKLKYAKTIVKKHCTNKNFITTVTSLAVAVTVSALSVLDVFGAYEVNAQGKSAYTEDKAEEVRALQPRELVDTDYIDSLTCGYTVLVDGEPCGRVSQRGMERIEAYISGILENASAQEGVTAETVEKITFEKEVFDSCDILSSNTVLSQIDINVKTTKNQVVSEVIPFETVYEDTDKLIKGQTMVETEGSDGLVTTTYEVCYVNGEEVSRQVVSESVVEPVDEVISSGTRSVANLSQKQIEAADGYAFPMGNASYYVSSVFGYRSFDDSFHNGIDYAADCGTPVYCAWDGEVIFAGWDDTGYGNFVMVKHTNGYITGYAHLSDYVVSAGDTVSAGQCIGAVGSTGYSTGNHLHFCVKIDGVYVDPAQIF